MPSLFGSLTGDLLVLGMLVMWGYYLFVRPRL